MILNRHCLYVQFLYMFSFAELFIMLELIWLLDVHGFQFLLCVLSVCVVPCVAFLCTPFGQHF